jgi:hypothetical protein
MSFAASLVAAGVVLRRDQDQTRPAGFSLMLRLGPERVQDADDCGICRENAQAHRCDDSGEEEDRHNQRDHVQPTFKNQSLCNASPTFTHGLSAKAKRQASNPGASKSTLR